VIAILEIVGGDQPTGNLVAVKGNVLSKSPLETIYSPTMRKSLNKVDAIVSDSTSAIRLTLWQNNIDDVEKDACYLFQNLRVSFYQRNYLATTMTTTINKIEETVELSEESNPTVTGTSAKPPVCLTNTVRQKRCCLQLFAILYFSSTLKKLAIWTQGGTIGKD
jgi:hypothetical protein